MDNRDMLSYFEQNTAVELSDLLKYLYQSCFGCEHLVSDFQTALARICKEAEDAQNDDLPELEPLDGNFCRIHLKRLRNGMLPETLCRLFLNSSQEQVDGAARLERELEWLLSYAREEKLPFTEDKVAGKVREWKRAGYPPIHHSETYREAHHPAYRVVKKEYVRLLPLLDEIDRMLRSDAKSILIALDGRCAAGKTTISNILSEIYDCNVFHMDDYFLRPMQRTKERLMKPGENIDHERFREEILDPLVSGRPVTYQKYDCAKQALAAPIFAPQKRMNVIEGVYSLHPELIDFYDFTVFVQITEEEQKERIVKRNSEEMAQTFFSTWIPLEETYFAAFDVQEKANMTL